MLCSLFSMSVFVRQIFVSIIASDRRATSCGLGVAALYKPFFPFRLSSSLFA